MMAGGIYPDDPLALPLSQEPRSLVVPPSTPGTPQAVGVALADIPSRLVGADGIKVANSGLDWRVSMNIAPLTLAEGQPDKQWIPVWIEGQPYDSIKRVPVNAIPADAPADSIVYGRMNGTWVPAIESVTIAWDDVTDKPTTFPPELPIPSSGVTGLDAKQSEQDGRLSVNETNIAVNTGAIAALDADLTAVEGVNTIQNSRLDAVETKNTTQDTRLDNVETKNTSQDTAINAKVGEAPTDGFQYARKNSAWEKVTGGAIISDTPPAGALPASFWWESDTGGLFIRYEDADSAQWVQVNPPSIGDAPQDGYSYSRNNGVWQSGGYVSNDIRVVKPGAYFIAEGPDDNLSIGFRWNRGSSSRWIALDSGNASGNDWQLQRYNAAGTYQDSPIRVFGATGNINMSGTLAVAGNISAAGSISAPGATINSIAGISMKAPLAFNDVTNFVIGYTGSSIYTTGEAYHQFAFGGTTRFRIEQSGILRWLTDNACTLGASSYRYSIVYAATGTINTSDEKEKQDIRALNEAELRVARALKPLICAYRWKHAVAEKGDDARIHVGVIAQRVEEAFAAEGLDASRYGMFCIDEIEEWVHPVVEDDDDGIARQVEEGFMRKTGEIRYGVRYDELAMFILAGM